MTKVQEMINPNKTKCNYCCGEVLTTLGLDYKQNGKIFCCKECAEDDKEDSRQ